MTDQDEVRYLLDTNALSELVKSSQDRRVVAWIDAHERQSFVSTVTFAEIRRGVELLGPGRRRVALDEWTQEILPRRFAGRIIDVDLSVATTWGTLMVRSERLGRRLDPIDAFIGAAAATHGLTLVTRSISHFDGLDLQLFDPWNSAQS